MKKKKFLKILSLLLAICTILPMAFACKKNGNEDGADTGDGNQGNKPSGISNENTPLAIASEALDGVFNPFFHLVSGLVCKGNGQNLPRLRQLFL